MAEITNITKKTIERSKIVASKIENKDLRKRVYALNIAANTTAEYLSANGLPADSKLSLFRIPSFAKNMELADIYVKGIRLDVRLTFDGNTFTVPKIQEKYNAKPAAYVVVQLSKDLTKAQILGFVPSEELGDIKSNSEYLTYQISVLKPLQQLRAFVSSVSVEQHIFSSVEHEKIKELCTAFLDEEISESEKVYLIKHLIGCPVCRETFCDLNDFDVIVSQVKNYHELLNDSTLSVLSGNKKEVNEAALANLAVVENALEISEETPIAEPFLQEENLSEIEESNEAVLSVEIPPILPMGVPAIEEETQIVDMDLISDSDETVDISQDISDLSDLSDLLDENNENQSLNEEKNEKEENDEQTPEDEASPALEEELLIENTEESGDLLEDIAELEELTQEPVELEMIQEETLQESAEENHESNEENIETESQQETLLESIDETSEENEVLENANTADEIEPLENLNDLEDTSLDLEDLETLDALEPENEPKIIDESEPNQELTVEPELISEIDEVEQITEISEIEEITDISDSINDSIDEIQDITDDLTLIEPESLDELHEVPMQEIAFEEITTEESVLELSETVEEKVIEEKEPFVLSLEGEEEEVAQHEPIELTDEDEDEDLSEDETIQEDIQPEEEEALEADATMPVEETEELDADIQGLLDDDLLALLSDDAQSEQEISEPASQSLEAEPSLETETIYENYDIAQEPVQNEQFEDYTESDEDMISLDDEQQSFAQTQEDDSSFEASQGDDTIESLYSDTNVPQSEGDDPAQFELAQEPVSASTVNATKKIIVGAAVFLILAGGGAASWFFNHAKTQNDADMDTANPDAEMFNLQNTAGKDAPEAPAISQDLNKSMTNSFSDKPAAITITKLSWQVSEKLAQEASVKEYLQTAGKNIQMNLQNDLANSADINFNNSIKISFEIAPDNTLKGMQVLESSGSDQIDDIVLRSIKNTLKYVSVPKLKDFKSDYFLTLIINF